MAGNVNLPEGFVLDGQEQPQSSTLPEGFVVDSPTPTQQGIDWQAHAKSILAPYQNVPEWGRNNPNLYGVAGAAREALGPVAEALGLAGGAAIGSAAGPVGGVAGAGLGYAGVKQGLNQIDVALGNKPDPGIVPAAVQGAKDVATGAVMEAGGQVAGQAIAGTAKLIGKGIKQTIGSTTGSGAGAVDEALKGGESFTNAMRGKTSGDQVVDDVRNALNSLKEQRAAEYTKRLAQLSGDETPTAYVSTVGPMPTTRSTQPIDITPVRNKMTDLLYQYGVKPGENGALDFSRSTFSSSVQKDIQETVDTIRGWGSQKGDNTPIMLDTLKRKLDDMVNWDSNLPSQAKQFIGSLRTEVKNLLVAKVPEYAEMTKGYSEATSLIRDIESGLMLRKQGMTGRVTGDMTLRRLTSAMRENFELRKDLLNILGEKSGQDLTGEVAGYSMNQLIPRGLVGKLSAGSLGYLTYLNPKFWPLVAASSPRVAGEFLNAYGAAMRTSAGQVVKSSTPALGRTIAFKAANQEE